MLKFWDARQSNPVGVLQLPERCYDLDVRDSLMVVATAGRHIISYNVQGQPIEHEHKESPLKFQSVVLLPFLTRLVMPWAVLKAMWAYSTLRRYMERSHSHLNVIDKIIMSIP